MSLKNCVLEGSRLDFGGPKARLWSLWASILADFEKFWDRFFGRRLARKCFLPPLGGVRWNPPLHGSPPTFLPTNGEAAVAPPGGSSIRRPPKVCQRRAERKSNWLCPITAGQSRHSFAQFDLKCSFPFPFLSPGAWGPPQTRRQKAEKFGFFAFLVDFFAFRTALEK